MSIEGFNRVKDCRHGRMLYNVHDTYIGRSLDLYGEFSEGEIDLFKPLIRPDDVVVEVGANIGVHTVWFAKATAGGGAVMAFEPQRLIFQALCANLALNSIVNALAFQQACGATSGGFITVPIIDPTRSGNFGALELADGAHTVGDEVPLVRLDDFELPRCRLLKIDVEGMELEVLKGAGQLIRRCKPLLYVENDREEKSEALVRHIASLGYDLYLHLPTLYSPANFFANADNVFGNIVSLNMLCVPSGSEPPAGLQKVKVPA